MYVIIFHFWGIIMKENFMDFKLLVKREIFVEVLNTFTNKSQKLVTDYNFLINTDGFVFGFYDKIVGISIDQITGFIGPLRTVTCLFDNMTIRYEGETLQLETIYRLARYYDFLTNSFL